MSELRQDPLNDRWVVIAQNRARRPQEYRQLETHRDATDCPFCVGNETQTPAAVATYHITPGDSRRDWHVRVVPNKYPAVDLSPAGDTFGEAGRPDESGSHVGRHQAGVGAHEVIIESPDHVVSFSELTDPQAEYSFRAYRDRLLALQSNPRLAYALIFKNTRAGAGASLEHVHSQLIALPWVPPEVQYEMTKSHEHFALHGTALMETVLDAEVADGRRIVTSTDRFTVFCPAASRMPYETWIVPRRPAPRFELESDEALVEAAHIVRDVIVRLEQVIDRPAYNYWIHSAPLRDNSGRIHWRIEISPRLARLAGFEIGTGCFINPVAPEEAAARLR